MNNIKDVARLAGVSASTVSRALSDKACVSDETRERIRQAAAELNYSPNVIAKSLKMGRTNTIALLLPSIRNHIFPEIASGVEDEARRCGVTVILCNTDEDERIEKEYLAKLRAQWVDGVIVSTMKPGSDHIRKLRDEGFPIVLTSRYYGDDGFDAVAVDNFGAARGAVDYLIKRGHKRIAVALGSGELNIYKDRFRGYRQALTDNGLAFDEALVLHDSGAADDLYFKVQTLFSFGPAPDALFATNDPKAIIALRAIRDVGLRVPQDVSVLGFDNIELSAMLEPPLTTVSQPFYQMGALAMKKLLCQIEAKEAGKPYRPRVNLMDTELIIRKSTR
ncbi:MAG: LacI family DNA-binding transcriptional regulator [Oscillospiraceae bacterium]|nr:LacI family DNA-binding transcriptional regulator [Oscillospiraceae bacterium]